MLLLAAAALLLAGCAAPARSTGAAGIALGQSVSVGGLRVTPLAVLEDSRCPTGVQCIQAGTVRLRARIDASEALLTLGEAHPVAGGAALTLSNVKPERAQGDAVRPDDYRFIFASTRRPAS
jgi:hypothetical protein